MDTFETISAVAQGRPLTFDEVSKILRAEHSIYVYPGPGPATWSCSCGQQSIVSALARTEAQVAAKADQHRRGARRRIIARHAAGGQG